MTDYEMADKYVTDTGNNDCTIEAYIAGLKAGKDMAEADLATVAYMQGAGAREKRIAELEKEIAELDCQKNRNKSCYSCANATEMCFRNEIGCPCGKYKSYKDENAELKDDNKVMADNYSKMERKFFNNLTEAKDIIKDYKIVVEGGHITVCGVPEENRSIDVLKLNEQAEQFLIEVSE